jgi:hypothetical protein
MKETYFDFKNCLLRTHVLLQDIKKMEGIKTFLTARKLLAEFYIMCKMSWDFLDMYSFDYFLKKTENYVHNADIKNEHIKIDDIKRCLGFIMFSCPSAIWWNIPMDVVDKLTLYQFTLYLENKMTEQIIEEEEALFDMPEIDEDDDDMDNGNNPWEF